MNSKISVSNFKYYYYRFQKLNQLNPPLADYFYSQLTGKYELHIKEK